MSLTCDVHGPYIGHWSVILPNPKLDGVQLDMARYGPFNNPEKNVGSCNLGNLGNFWHEMAKSKIAKIRN